jgi:hypothetical protein
MKQNPWEAKSHPVSWETPSFMEPEGSLLQSQEPVTGL